jgi:hypothetical protein
MLERCVLAHSQCFSCGGAAGSGLPWRAPVPVTAYSRSSGAS